MALIGKIRKHSGFLVIIIGVALASFVLSDFLTPRSRNQRTDVGEIAGETITYNEFSARAEEQLEMMKERAQKEQLTADEIFQTKQNTWNQILNEILMGREYEKLGLAITPEELFDQVQGPNPHAYILQYFRNPQTNQYEPNLVLNYLKNLDQMEPKAKEQWLVLEKAIKEDRISTKYRNLIGKAYYVPTAFAKQEYTDRSRQANILLVGVRYNVIPDNEVSVTEEDFVKFYEENKYKYQQEKSRDLDYVIFEVAPSPEDMAAIDQDVNEIYQEFQVTDDVPAYINANSDDRYDSTFFKKGELPFNLDSLMFSAQPGFIVGPYRENDFYKIARLVDVQFRPDSMKASHILIAFRGAANAPETVTRTKEQAEALRDSLMQELMMNRLRFPELAAQYSDDPSVKENGGNLDWFKDGTMVGPFNDASLNNPVGSLTTAETVFGFHIIDVTDKKEAEKKVRVGIISRSIEPSTKTFQDRYAAATKFASENTSAEAFAKTVQEQGLNLRSATNVLEMDNRIPGVDYPRGIIQWAFMDETEKGSVSAVFDVDGKYVVALLKEIREKGTTPLELVKPSIEPLVIRDKKAQKLMEQIKASSVNDLYSLAIKYNTKVDTIPNLVFASPNLPGYGPEPELLGNIFVAPQGAVKGPVKGNVGVYVYAIESYIEPPAKEDFTMEKQSMRMNFESKVSRDYFRVLQDKADIEDNRALFF